MSKFSSPLQATASALSAGDRDTAWTTLYPIMRYPYGASMTEAEFTESMGMLEAIGQDVFAAAIQTALVGARSAPTDPQALFGAGFRLNQANLPELAASVLARANTLAPNVPTLVNEYASALQASGSFNEAFMALHGAEEARSQDWQSRNLYALNALLAGNVIAAQQAFDSLGEPADVTQHTDKNQLSRFLERQAQIRPVTALDFRDLRGWHYVITGGTLTHVASDSFDEGMHGRYSSAQDSDELIHEGVLRAVAVLQAWNIRPSQLIYSDDRSSEILSHVWNKRLGIPTKVFRPDDVDSSGLFLAYDLRQADPKFLEALRQYRPDQVLASHASCWTQESDYTSDISTYQYQTNAPLWNAEASTLPFPSQIGTADGSEVVERAAVAERILAFLAEPNEVAERIVASTVSPEAIADLDQLAAIAAAAGPPPTSGFRDEFLLGSPVKSTRSR